MGRKKYWKGLYERLLHVVLAPARVNVARNSGTQGGRKGKGSKQASLDGSAGLLALTWKTRVAVLLIVDW